jgi:hypothetical protein
MRVLSELGQLTVSVRALDGGVGALVRFVDVVAYRVMDERDLGEYWPTCSTPNGWLFEIADGGWLSQEAMRPSSLLAHLAPVKEYLVTGEDDCVSVICANPPEVIADEI